MRKVKLTRKDKEDNYIDKYQRKRYKSLYPTSDDDSGIRRQARLDSNSQLPNLLYKVKVREESSFGVCLTSEGWRPTTRI